MEQKTSETTVATGLNVAEKVAAQQREELGVG